LNIDLKNSETDAMKKIEKVIATRLKRSKRNNFYKMESKQIIKSDIGRLVDPLQRYDKISYLRSVYIPSYFTDSMVYVEGKKQIVIIDKMERSFKVIDTEGNYIQTVYLKEFLKEPRSICFNTVTDELFVTDKDLILVFNSHNFQLQRYFDTIVRPKGIAIDCETQILYVGIDYSNQDLLALNCISGEIIRRVNMNSFLLYHISQTKDILLLLSYKAIILLSKNSFEITKVINLNYECKILEIVTNQFILTLDYDKLNSIILLDFDGKVVSRTKLNFDFKIENFCKINNRMILNSALYHPSIHIVNFE
jgi:hypothetical protein